MDDLSQFTPEQLAAARSMAEEIDPPFDMPAYFSNILEHAMIKFDQALLVGIEVPK
jgi:hypothetical protein